MDIIGYSDPNAAAWFHDGDHRLDSFETPLVWMEMLHNPVSDSEIENWAKRHMEEIATYANYAKSLAIVLLHPFLIDARISQSWEGIIKEHRRMTSVRQGQSPAAARTTHVNHQCVWYQMSVLYECREEIPLEKTADASWRMEVSSFPVVHNPLPGFRYSISHY